MKSIKVIPIGNLLIYKFYFYPINKITNKKSMELERSLKEKILSLFRHQKKKRILIKEYLINYFLKKNPVHLIFTKLIQIVSSCFSCFDKGRKKKLNEEDSNEGKKRRAKENTKKKKKKKKKRLRTFETRR